MRGRAENVVDYILHDMFSEAMSDNLSIIEQDIGVASATTPEFSRASLNCADPIIGTAENPDIPGLLWIVASMNASGD